MSQPEDREVKKVSMIEALSASEVKTLYDVLQVLGFDLDTIALMWGKDPDFVRSVFNGRGMTGAELADICQRINIRPGVIQGRLNFDERPPRRKKRGFKSTPVPTEWVGPPELCLTGAASEGRAFKEVFLLPGVSSNVPARSQFDQSQLQQIGKGNYPVRLQALRDMLAIARVHHPNAAKLSRLEAVLAAFPGGVLSVEDVFAPAETTTESPSPKEGLAMMDQTDRAFVERFKAAQIGSALVNLIEWRGLNGWVYGELEWNDDVLCAFSDGDAAPFERELRMVWQKIGEPTPMHERRSDYEAILTRLQEWEVSWAKPQEPQGIEGHSAEMWFPDENLVVANGTKLTISGTHRNVVTQRIYRTLQACLAPLGRKWPDFVAKLPISTETVKSLAEGRCRIDADWVDSLLKALDEHYEVSLSIEQLFGLAELPASLLVVPEPDPEPVQALPEPPKPVVRAPLPDVSAEADAFGKLDQPAIARFISSFVARSPQKNLLDLLAAASIGYRPHNNQVVEGNRVYSRAQLEQVAEYLGVTYAQLTEADDASLPVPLAQDPNKVPAEGDQRVIAANISRLMIERKSKKTEVMSIIGENRMHNTKVMEDPSRFAYSEAQLEQLASHFNVSVDALRGASEEGLKPASTDVEAGPIAASGPDEVEQSSSRQYDARDKALRTIVVGQLKRLKDHLGISGKDFVKSAVSASPSILYGQVRIERYHLVSFVDAFKDRCPWLSFEWFLLDVEIPVAVEDAVDSPVEQTAHDADDSKAIVESAAPKSVPAQEAVPVEGSEPEIALRLRGGDRFAKSLFFKFAAAGLIEQDRLLALFRKQSEQEVEPEWQAEVDTVIRGLLAHSVFGPLVRSVDSTERMYFSERLTALMRDSS